MFKNFLRQFLLLSDIAVNVVRTFLESKYLPDDFETFLEKNKALLYHLHDIRRSGCCTCVNLPRQQIIRKAQFDKLFVGNGNLCQQRAQRCHCKFVATPKTKPSDIDLTLGITLLNNCFTLTPQEEQSFTDIRTIRNEISHFSHDNDIDDSIFNNMWGKITSATIYLTMCISQEYSQEVQEKIRLLKERTLLPVEYTDSLLVMCQWKLNHDEKKDETFFDITLVHQLSAQTLVTFNKFGVAAASSGIPNAIGNSTSKILDILQAIQFQNVVRDERIESMESRILDAIGNQRSTENHGIVGKLPVEETEFKTVDQSNVLDEDDDKYLKLFGEVKQLRQHGNEDAKTGMLYSVLVYIVLHGSAAEKDINLEILTNMYNSIYKSIFPSETVSTETCLTELVPKYLDQVYDKFTPCSINVAKAVICLFGDESCECFVQHCSLDILLDYGVQKGTFTKDCHVPVEACALAPALVNRMQSHSDARSVGKYIFKSVVVHRNVETADLFIDAVEKSNEHFTSDHMINLLDGLTKDGNTFSIFEKLEKLFNLFCRQVDKFGNTVFHYLVTRISESKTFLPYIKFFCENNIVVMLLENNYDHNALDFASYQGRYDVIENIIKNVERTDDMDARILTMVKKGVDFLQCLNSSKSELKSDLHISMKNITLSGNRDYIKICNLIRKEENVCLLVDNTYDEEKKSSTIKEEKKSSPNKEEKNIPTKDEKEDDTRKTVEEGIICLVTEIKKGLDIIANITKIIKTIHLGDKT